MISDHSKDPRTELFRQIDVLLAETLGAIPIRPGRQKELLGRPPMVVAMALGAAYAVLFCGLPWLLGQPPNDLFYLSAWGSAYLAFAAFLARVTSSAVLHDLKVYVIPVLSDDAIQAIHDDIGRRFRPMRVALVSTGVALVAATLSAMAIRRDIVMTSGVELIWWSIGFFVLYVLAARTTDVARFYGSFAASIKIDREKIYKIDPAHSVQINAIARIGKRILIFWLLITCAVLSLLPLFGEFIWFISFVVPTASSFSLLFAAVVFFDGESDLRRVVSGVASSTLLSLEREAGELFDRRASLNEHDWSRLKELELLHKGILASGQYQSVILSFISVLAPFAVPTITIVTNWDKIQKLWQ